MVGGAVGFSDLVLPALMLMCTRRDEKAANSPQARIQVQRAGRLVIGHELRAGRPRRNRFRQICSVLFRSVPFFGLQGNGWRDGTLEK